MNNKSFKSNYNDYMKNIKPSQELINKTIQLAHKEQENLQHSKNKNFFRFLYNLDFKKYGVLACTFIFAIFAVKLWSSLSQEEIPTEFPKDTITTTTSSATNMTDVSDSSIITTIKDNNNNNNIIDNSTIEYNTYTDSSQVIDTLTTSVPISQTSVDEFITIPSENTPSYVIDTSEDIIVTTVPNENVSISDNLENVIVTTVPTETINSEEENSPIDNTTISKLTSLTDSTSKTSTYTTTTTTTTVTSSSNTNANVTTTITTNTSGDIGASGGDINVSEGDIDVSGGDINVSEIISVTDGNMDINETQSTTTPSNLDGMTSGELGCDNAVDEVPCTTTIPENTTIEVATTEPSMDAPDNSLNSLNKYVAFKLNLLEKYNGFYYNNSINMNKIKNYLSFGDDIVFVTPLNSNTIANGCECIMVIEVQSFNNTVLNSLMLELNNEYSYVENFYEDNNAYEPETTAPETTTPEFVEETTSSINDVKVYAKPFQCYEDINGNGIPISEDLEDQQIILNELNVQY